MNCPLPLAVADPASGKWETVVELPGFTRGLAFAGDLAFVGLSKVRERVFDDLPLGERLRERTCGVWVIDLRSGTVAGFLRFDGEIEEVFDVQWLPGVRWPELVEPGADLVGSAFQVPDGTLDQFRA